MLLVRTTRAVTLTDVGADYLARTEPLLAALEEAEHAARRTGELRGALRIAVSSSFGVREVIPRLPAFLERHPALRIDLDINDARQDLITDGVDVALRIGPMPDSSALARKLAGAARLLLASPSYLQRFDRPRAPGDLASHAVIIGPGATGAWEFAKDGRRVSVRVEGRLRTAANEGATAAAVAGLGVTRTSFWGCRAELEARRARARARGLADGSGRAARDLSGRQGALPGRACIHPIFGLAIVRWPAIWIDRDRTWFTSSSRLLVSPERRGIFRSPRGRAGSCGVIPLGEGGRRRPTG